MLPEGIAHVGRELVAVLMSVAGAVIADTSEAENREWAPIAAPRRLQIAVPCLS